MNETLQTNQDYLQQHPNAVQDIGLAHSMALAGDQYETEAARVSTETASKLGKLAAMGENPTVFANEAAQQIREITKGADVKYEEIKTAHEIMAGLKR